MATGTDSGRPGERQDLTAAARALIARTVTDLTGPAAARLNAILAGLSDPLRVAMVGRRNAGKSTIVNALLGERVAPTDRLECTKLVAWYRSDDYNHARVVTRDGSKHDIVLLSGGRLPSELDVGEQEISDIEVWLRSEALRNKTLIDTPGFDTFDPQTEARTRELFEGHTVDAIALVFNRNVKADEIEALRRFGQHIVQVNVVGVLTKADTLDVEDPWPEARRLAAKYAGTLDSAATVVPVLGLMAETAATHRLTGDDAWYLRELVDLPADALLAADLVTAAESKVPVEARDRLLELLGVYGLRYAIDQVRSGRDTVPELTESLAEHSGLRLLQSTLDTQFSERADILKAHSAMQEFIGLSRKADGPDRDRLRQGLDEALRLTRHPRLHVLRELAAYESCLAGEVELPDDLMECLRRLACERGLAARLGLPAGSPDAAVRKALLTEGGRWNAFINDAATSAAQKEVALVAQMSYGFAWESIEEQQGGSA